MTILSNVTKQPLQNFDSIYRVSCKLRRDAVNAIICEIQKFSLDQLKEANPADLTRRAKELHNRNLSIQFSDSLYKNLLPLVQSKSSPFFYKEGADEILSTICQRGQRFGV